MRWWKQRHREASPPVVQVRRSEGHPFGVLDRYTPLGGGSVELYRAIRPSANGLLECLVTFNAPFTLLKGLLDVALCLLIYKPLSPLLHGKV